jgi:hypothetical protein
MNCHGLRTIRYGLAVASLLAVLCCGCTASSNQPMTSSNAPPTSTQPSGGWWVLYGDEWVYVEGDRPEICDTTVCAAAGGSAILAYRFDTFGFDKEIRFVLLESKSGGYVQFKDKEKQRFDETQPSYIDAHLGSKTADSPKPCGFTLQDLIDNKKPQGFSHGLWKRLRSLHATAMNHNHNLPEPGVADHK